MRKVLWWFGAAAVACGGMAYLTADYTDRHPESFVGRCVIGSYQLHNRYNPVSRLGKAVAAKFGGARDQGAVAAAGSRAAAVDQASPRVPEADGPEVTLAAPQQGEAARSEQEDARLPGRIVIEEEAQRGDRPLGGLGEESEEPALFVPQGNGPRQADAVPMPYAHDTDTGADRKENGWFAFLRMVFPGFKPEATPAGVGEENEIKDTRGAPDCREDKDYHRHYPGCPYMGGCPYTGKCYPPPPPVVPEVRDPKPDDKPSDLPEAEAALRKRIRTTSFYPMIQPGWCDNGPRHPDVDTTEFRPSDAKPYTYRTFPY